MGVSRHLRYNINMSEKILVKIPYFVYILQCADKTFYIGSTNNLKKRLHQHNNLKSGAHYTKIRRPTVLMHSEKFETYSESRRREGEIKMLSREQKLQLIKSTKIPLK